MDKEVLISAIKKVYEEKLSKIVGFETDYKKLVCSFCGKDQSKVYRLIAGNHVYICDECVVLCSEILEEEKQKFK